MPVAMELRAGGDDDGITILAEDRLAGYKTGITLRQGNDMILFTPSQIREIRDFCDDWERIYGG